ncbi:MAG: hypothetical protein AAB891_01460, partial [Patescibacteria group bacterium]
MGTPCAPRRVIRGGPAGLSPCGAALNLHKIVAMDTGLLQGMRERLAKTQRPSSGAIAAFSRVAAGAVFVIGAAAFFALAPTAF